MSLVRNKKSLYQGLILIISFAVLFWAMFQPFFRDSEGRPMNALEWTDAIFNQLSKGSSWFVPEVLQAIHAAGPMPVSLKVKIQDEILGDACVTQLNACGIRDARYEQQTLSFSGNLADVLEAATNDAADLYNNDGASVQNRHGASDPLLVSQAWWHLLTPCVKELQKQGSPAMAKLVEQVVKKAVEAGNNFYGLPVAHMADNVFLVCGLLAFYVLYAIWYGFAIYHLFAGFGLLGSEEAGENVEESEI